MRSNAVQDLERTIKCKKIEYSLIWMAPHSKTSSNNEDKSWNSPKPRPSFDSDRRLDLYPTTCVWQDINKFIDREFFNQWNHPLSGAISHHTVRYDHIHCDCCCCCSYFCLYLLFEVNRISHFPERSTHQCFLPEKRRAWGGMHTLWIKQPKITALGN